jgi:hypothetical protein
MCAQPADATPLYGIRPWGRRVAGEKRGRVDSTMLFIDVTEADGSAAIAVWLSR